MRLLAVGDLHLGRRPSRLPESIDAAGLGPGEAWRRTVDAAIGHRATAVLLAGDVVDRERDFFEAYRELAAGVRRLVDAGIKVAAVAGNHDVQVLPRLADELPDFTLLGRGGRWQSLPLEADGQRVTVWGWSFPQSRVTGSPLAAPDSPAAAGFDPGPGLHLGLLHCDRDQAGSPYAPVTSAELAAARLDGWLLGHIHKPDPLGADNLSGYLGSVSAAHPGESGARGPWLLQIGRGSVRAMKHLALAPLRYLPLEVDLSGIDGVEQSRSRVLAALRGLDGELAASGWVPQAVALRLRFGGRSRFGHQALEALSPPEDRDHVFTGGAGTRYFIEHLVVDTLPEADLPALARRADPVGVLAGRLLCLDRAADDAERQALVRGALQRLRDRQAERAWQGLQRPVPDEAMAEVWLRRSGMQLLDHLLAQVVETSDRNPEPEGDG